MCDNVSRSTLLLQPTQEAKEISQFAVKLLKQVKVVASDIRGMGLQLSKLVSTQADSTAAVLVPGGAFGQQQQQVAPHHKLTLHIGKLIHTCMYMYMYMYTCVYNIMLRFCISLMGQSSFCSPAQV